MKPRKGYYCLIQYSPDPSRAEAVNIGVLLFCPERRFIAARTSTSNRRIERFFKRGSFNPFQVNEAKRALEERVQVERDHIELEEQVAPIFAVNGVRFVRRIEVPKFAQEVESDVLAHGRSAAY